MPPVPNPWSETVRGAPSGQAPALLATRLGEKASQEPVL